MTLGEVRVSEQTKVASSDGGRNVAVLQAAAAASGTWGVSEVFGCVLIMGLKLTGPAAVPKTCS